MSQINFKSCEKCSKVFKTFPYNHATRRFCSRQCANPSTAKQQSITRRSNAKMNLTNKRWRYNVLYIEWRNHCIERDNSTCQNCLNQLKPRDMVIHHIKSWRDYPELRYEVTNGTTLCRSCHNLIHVLPSRKINKGY